MPPRALMQQPAAAALSSFLVVLALVPRPPPAPPPRPWCGLHGQRPGLWGTALSGPPDQRQLTCCASSCCGWRGAPPGSNLRAGGRRCPRERAAVVPRRRARRERLERPEAGKAPWSLAQPYACAVAVVVGCSTRGGWHRGESDGLRMCRLCAQLWMDKLARQGQVTGTSVPSHAPGQSAVSSGNAAAENTGGHLPPRHHPSPIRPPCAFFARRHRSVQQPPSSRAPHAQDSGVAHLCHATRALAPIGFTSVLFSGAECAAPLNVCSGAL